MTEKYKTIVVDPPWPGPGSCPRGQTHGSGAMVIPYQTMTGVQCAALRIREMASEDSQLWLWTTSRNVADAFLLMSLWAYKYCGLFVWRKKGLGMGRHMRHQCEFLLWGARPGARLVKPKNCPHQIQEWPNPKAHSEKPAEAYEFIRSLSDGPRIDIFARQVRPGFEGWGNEYPLDKCAAAVAQYAPLSVFDE